MIIPHQTTETPKSLRTVNAAAMSSATDSHEAPPAFLRGREGLRLVSFGILSWLPVFAVGTALQAWRQVDFPLFQAALVLTTASTVTFFAAADLQERRTATLRRGVLAGLIWYGMHALLGAMAFVGGPLEMPIAHFRTLLVCLFLIPTITVGMGHMARSTETQGAPKRPPSPGPGLR